MKREILLGDEAIGLGAIHSGMSGIYGYPGTPSTEIFEYVERVTKADGNIHAFWSTNEKVAYEEALGMSWAGKRALVCMKHVGLNVAADAFMNSAITGTNGGLVLAVADDPGMHSSQNEQDSRFFAQFALIPCFEPRNQQQCYDMMFEAFELSEELSVPVMVRLVTRIAHSRAGVAIREPRQQNELDPSKEIKKWTLLPSNARVQYKHLTDKRSPGKPGCSCAASPKTTCAKTSSPITIYRSSRSASTHCRRARCASWWSTWTSCWCSRTATRWSKTWCAAYSVSRVSGSRAG